MTEHVELLSRAANYAVVQLAGRSFPGVVVQGDSLNEIVNDLGAMVELLRTGRLDDLRDEIDRVRAGLSEALAHYEQVCVARGIELPYPKS